MRKVIAIQFSEQERHLLFKLSALAAAMICERFGHTPLDAEDYALLHEVHMQPDEVEALMRKIGADLLVDA